MSGVSPPVLPCCREELATDDFTHTEIVFSDTPSSNSIIPIETLEASTDASVGTAQDSDSHSKAKYANKNVCGDRSLFPARARGVVEQAGGSLCWTRPAGGCWRLLEAAGGGELSVGRSLAAATQGGAERGRAGPRGAGPA